MNQKGRERLLKAKEIIENEIEIERDKFLNLPESLQYGKPGEALEDIIMWLEEARDALNEVGV